MAYKSWLSAKASSLQVTRTDGSILETSGGQSILDAAGGAIVNNVGYGRRCIAEAMAAALEETSYVVPPWLTPSRAALIERLESDWLPEGFSRHHFCSGGSESVEAAIKIALLYQSAIGQPCRRKIISRDISYHGATLATIGFSGHVKRKTGLHQALTQNPIAPTPYPLRQSERTSVRDCGEHCIELTRQLIEKEGPETIAAFIGEPIVGSSGGAIVPPENYWPKLRKLCDEFGVLLICDEVMTGFGRTGTKFGFQHWDMQPDIIAAGKGLAGGYAPIGGVFTKTEIGDAIDEAGFNVMFHTFGGHPAACAAADHVLRIIAEEHLLERASDQGEVLSMALNSRFKQHPNVAEIRGRGLLQAIEIVRSRDSLDPFPETDAITERIVEEGLKRGVFYYGGGTGLVRDIVCFGPAFTVTEEEIGKMVDTLYDSVNAVLNSNGDRG